MEEDDCIRIFFYFKYLIDARKYEIDYGNTDCWVALFDDRLICRMSNKDDAINKIDKMMKNKSLMFLYTASHLKPLCNFFMKYYK